MKFLKKLGLSLLLAGVVQAPIAQYAQAWQFPISFFQPPPFPNGHNGSFVLNGFSSAVLAAGSIKDYSSFTITDHSTLYITGNGWAIIGVSGNFTVDATSSIIIQSTGPDGTYTAKTPDGHALSYTVVSTPGGAGGDFPDEATTGGIQVGGNGGGGAGFNNGNDAVTLSGGDGSDGFDDAGDYIPAGAGAAVYGNDGGVGADVDGSMSASDIVSASGGGGSHGYHGSGLSITVRGTVSLATGARLYANGGNGGGGGNGGSTDQTPAGYSSYSGAGGGGGAGGSGGKIDFRWKGLGTNPTAFLFFGGGAGGGGGGVAQADFNGNGGNSGSTGNNGSAVVSTF